MDTAAGTFDADVAATVDLARAFGHHAGRLRYAGVAPDHARGSVTVYRVPDPAFDSEIRTLLQGGVEIVLADAPHTRDELIIARETIWAYADRLAITAISVPVDGTVLVVTTEAPEHEVQAELDLLVPHLARASAGSTVAL